MAKLREYNLIFKNTSRFLECRQTRQPNMECAKYEAELYAEWAHYHYGGCKIIIEIEEQ